MVNIDNSVITRDEIIEETKAISTNFSNKKLTYKIKKFYILLAFLAMTIALLIAVKINCYLLKYKA